MDFNEDCVNSRSDRNYIAPRRGRKYISLSQNPEDEYLSSIIVNDDGTVEEGLTPYEMSLEQANRKKDASNKQFEEKVDRALEHIELIQNDHSLWAQNLQQLATLLSNRFCDSIILVKFSSLQELIDHGLKGKDEQIEASVRLLSVLILSLPELKQTQPFVLEQYRQVNKTLVDKNHSFESRSQCAIALSVACFIYQDVAFVHKDNLMSNLFQFAVNRKENDDDFTNRQTIKEHEDEAFAFQTLCINMFAFLVTSKLSKAFLLQCLSVDNIPLWVKCMQSRCLALRIATGQCLVLMLEKLNKFPRSQQPAIKSLNLHSIQNEIETLAREGETLKCKRNLRVKRNVYRNIAQSWAQNGQFQTEETIHFDDRLQSLTIDSWRLHRQYATCVLVLGGGIGDHLTSNQLIRDVFKLGTVIDRTDPGTLSLKELKLTKDKEHRKQSKLRDQETRANTYAKQLTVPG